MKVAAADSCSTNSMPDMRQMLKVAREYSAEEFALIQRGIIPQGMDEKWFIYYSDTVLHLHRSWTGNEIYQLKFDVRNPSVIKIKEGWVARDPKQYKGTDDAEDATVLLYLIDALLLNRQVDFPNAADLPPTQLAVLRHNIVGIGRSTI